MSKIERYRRSYHDSMETDNVLSILPGWMIWKEHNSLGYQFINAMFGNQAEYAKTVISEQGDNYHPALAYQNEPRRIWKTQHATTSGNIPPSSYITATLDTSNTYLIPTGTIYVDPETVELINADAEVDFFTGPPTRLSYTSADDITPPYISGDITGITFVKDWSKVDVSGVVLVPEQDVYIINQSIRTPQSGDYRNTVVYNTDWDRIDTTDYGLGIQDYDTAGSYEVITNPSGYTFRYNPIVSSIRVYDYINLDSDGNSQLMPSSTYLLSSGTTEYVTTTNIVLSGVNPYNKYPTQNSNYYVDYEYRKHSYPKQVTTPGASWGLQRHVSHPTFVSEPSFYSGTIITHEMAATPSGGSVALRIDPRDIRPGSAADIRFDYIDSVDVSWNNTAPFSYELRADTSFQNSASGGIHIYSDGKDLTPYFNVSMSGGSRAFILNNSAPPDPAPYTVRVYYNARKTYEDTVAVQSYASAMVDADPYPMDYMVENGYLIPYSILPISDSDTGIQTSLLVAKANQFTVTTDLIFDGIAYDEDKDCYWVLESNNMTIYKTRPSDGTILDKFNIFKTPNWYFSTYKSRVSGIIDRDQNQRVGYPFISHELDDGSRLASGIVYYDDYLYISCPSSTGVADAIGMAVGGSTTGVVIGGSGIYRLDTYNRTKDIEWNTDPAEVHPHFPYNGGVGTGVVDMTLNVDEDFLLATSGEIHRVGLHYDYALIDSDVGVTRGVVYYRENYQGVTVSGFPTWSN